MAFNAATPVNQKYWKSGVALYEPLRFDSLGRAADKTALQAM